MMNRISEKHVYLFNYMFVFKEKVMERCCFPSKFLDTQTQYLKSQMQYHSCSQKMYTTLINRL